MNFQKEKEGKQEREDLVHPMNSAQIWGHFTLCLMISQKKTENCSTISDSHLDNKRKDHLHMRDTNMRECIPPKERSAYRFNFPVINEKNGFYFPVRHENTALISLPATRKQL
jgi:hypothetical protein